MSATKMISSDFLKSQLIILKDSNWLDRQRFAGDVTARCLNLSKKLIEDKTPNLKLIDIEKECENLILNSHCIPTFKGYKGFPSSVCISVNKQIVHGIPNDYVLQDGDVVKIDIGVTNDGAIGDAAITIIYGNPKSFMHEELIKACKESLNLAINSVKIGQPIGIIGETIYHHAKNTGFKVITDFGGHGIDENTLHAKPFVDNRATKDYGVRIQPGMTFTIEPMFVIGNDKIKVDKNGWTIIADGISAHFEHTLFIHEDNVEILTKLE